MIPERRRCWGYNKNLMRCGNYVQDARYCGHHARQPYRIGILLITLVASLVTIASGLPWQRGAAPAAVESDLKALREELAELNKTIKFNNDALKESRERVSQLESSISKANSEITMLSDSAEAARHKLKKETEAFQGQLSKLRSELDQAQKVVDAGPVLTPDSAKELLALIQSRREQTDGAPQYVSVRTDDERGAVLKDDEPDFERRISSELIGRRPLAMLMAGFDFRSLDCTAREGTCASLGLAERGEGGGSARVITIDWFGGDLDPRAEAVLASMTRETRDLSFNSFKGTLCQWYASLSAKAA